MRRRTIEANPLDQLAASRPKGKGRQRAPAAAPDALCEIRDAILKPPAKAGKLKGLFRSLLGRFAP